MKNLINILNDHGVSVDSYSIESNTIKVVDEYSKNGQEYQELIDIDATRDAVYDFLQY